MRLTDEQIASLQRVYGDLINYQAKDPTAPIDPATYRASDGDRLIHIAALRGDAETVELLLAAGEDINAVGDMGDTPAHYAAMGEHRELFDLLLRRGADPSITNEFGMTVASAWGGYAREKR
jgi:ankyrin repeat protein